MEIVVTDPESIVKAAQDVGIKVDASVIGPTHRQPKYRVSTLPNGLL